MAIENLSEDLLMEILWRLPVKSLLQLKSVCKNWYALIQNLNFIYLHHDRAASIAADENTDCLLVKRFLDGGEGGVALSFVPNETPVGDIDMLSATGLDVKELRILGPCNGVVCLTRFALNSTIVICNPSMKEFRILPQPSYKNDHTTNLGFGYDPFSDDYKVVRFTMMSTDLLTWGIDEMIEIYDSSTDSWREVDTESPIQSGFYCCHDSYTSWNWDCFWYAYHKHGGSPVIMAFSMTNEVFEEMPVPEVCLLDQHSEKKLFVLNDSLVMVIYPKWWSDPSWIPPEDFMSKTFDIWVMNEEDVEVSWTKKFTIGPFQGLEWALGFRQNGEFLVESNYGQMMSYNLNTQERKEYQVHDQVQGRPPPPHLQVLPYTESLVSVNRGNEHDGHVE
ncbi:F-box/LRR-repeat/kelch-repeat protein At2g27520-like [Rhododendron vialii]|uniref:F-box/LRR-repeat/kelch-repeat protein At2g27520-like n=1 Tax=Rhododendron vialii TaxID=182163 RepID=UPI00265D78B7|nr:F-box/LRR-repeat/kelch-repeat protein At2g27520-like [Rhododendron vialii]